MKSLQLQFWFEFASTYSYLAAGRVERIAAEAGAALAWRPFLRRHLSSVASSSGGTIAWKMPSPGRAKRESTANVRHSRIVVLQEIVCRQATAGSAELQY